MPVSPSSTMSGIPPTRLPTTPRPRQNASTTTRPRPSERDGSTRTLASSSALATSGVDNDSVHRVCAGSSATSCSATSRSVPRPTRCEPRVRDARGGQAPGVSQHVDRLVPLEDADEQSDRLFGQRDRLALDERLEIHERGELGRRLDTRGAHEPGRIRRDRPHAVTLAQPTAGERVGERRERPAPRRPVEPCRRRRIAVDVRDHACRDARERASEHAERRLLRALSEHGVRPERAQLTCHAKREKRVERRSVERPWPDRAHELETRVGPAPSTRARENSNVELGRERVELLGERGRQRKGVPRPPDHEQPLLHATAFRSSASIAVKTASSE